MHVHQAGEGREDACGFGPETGAGMREGTGVPICRAAERLGVRARDGRFAGIVAGDLGQGGGVVALRKGWSWQAGPMGQRVERARHDEHAWAPSWARERKCASRRGAGLLA